MTKLLLRRMVPAIYLWIPLALSLLAPSARAAEATRLYEARVPVAGQDGAARADAIGAAFKEVLVKITGNRQAPGHPSLKDELANASRYVQQFRYASNDGGEGEQRELQVNFDQGSVDRMLRGKGLPLWGSTRPEVLLWLAAESKGQRSFLVPERYKPVYGAALDQAAARGVPLLLPLLDLEDQSALPMGDLWGGFARNIRRASDRYAADAILTGRFTQQGNGWNAAWTLMQGDHASHWEGHGQRMADAVSQGLNEASDRLAAQYAPMLTVGAAAGTENAVRVWVSGIDGLAGYAKVSNYLRALDGVEGLSVRTAAPGVAAFTLKIPGGIEALERAVALGTLLMPDALPEVALAPRPAPATAGVTGNASIPVEADGATAPVEEIAPAGEAAAQSEAAPPGAASGVPAGTQAVDASAPVAAAPSALPDVPQIAYRIRL